MVTPKSRSRRRIREGFWKDRLLYYVGIVYSSQEFTGHPRGLMSVFDEPPRYRSYLLTFWEERGRDPDEPAVWRFSLGDPRTGQRRAFATLGALMAALEQEMVAAGASDRERGQ
jgi:hypothetical protein